MLSVSVALLLTMVQPDPSAKKCTVAFTDCNEVERTVEWYCTSAQQCCVHTYMSVGPDGQQNTADDCIVGVSTGCNLDPCNTTFWIS